MQQLSNILQNLMQQAEQLDADNRRHHKQLSEQWFAHSLFKCRSNLAIDYVAETQRLATQLEHSNNEHIRTFIAEQISQQLTALSTALRGNQLPLEKRDSRLRQQSRIAALHQKLVTYRGYEQRLLHNVKACRDRHDTLAAQQQEKRLNRCQQAIQALEQDIQRLEEGR